MVMALWPVKSPDLARTSWSFIFAVVVDVERPLLAAPQGGKAVVAIATIIELALHIAFPEQLPKVGPLGLRQPSSEFFEC
jgi:hypothetical protein